MKSLSGILILLLIVYIYCAVNAMVIPTIVCGGLMLGILLALK
jgi:hypothetical protein